MCDRTLNLIIKILWLVNLRLLNFYCIGSAHSQFTIHQISSAI